jgi:endonuclease-3
MIQNVPSSRTIIRILDLLLERNPNPGGMELGNTYRTLVGVILSARTRDEQVLKLLPKFFESYPDIVRLSNADEAQIRLQINTIGMYKQKAKNLKKMAEKVVHNFQGQIPNTMENLVQLPGVGRKTASVMLVSCFQKPAIAVDTHVHRVTNRLGWVKTKTPKTTEQALLKIIPIEQMKKVNRVFVKFGRSVCIPGKPRCYLCPILKYCPYKNKNLSKPKDLEQLKKKLEQRESELEHLRQSVAK